MAANNRETREPAQDRMKRTQVCLWPEEYEKVMRIAVQRGSPMGEVIRRAIQYYPEAAEG